MLGSSIAHVAVELFYFPGFLALWFSLNGMINGAEPILANYCCIVAQGASTIWIAAKETASC